MLDVGGCEGRDATSLTDVRDDEHAFKENEEKSATFRRQGAKSKLGGQRSGT